ncbi:MAG TPA: PspC domain-containing protein [Anaeromyxobacteraceae bacterium]|jgi:phage shock protein PspC (stress-responsive transcriptional regulator)|nr:PspC domain-containing protein [Anaeromyxobacteraceae bacterium]
MTCPYCKTDNHPQAVKCAACGSWIAERPRVREWERAREGKMIAGVCRGLANRFDLPVAALRIAFLLTLLLGAGLGLLIYIAFWIAMPLEPAPAAMPAGPIVTPPPPAAPRIEQPQVPQS